MKGMREGDGVPFAQGPLAQSLRFGGFSAYQGVNLKH